MAKITNQRLDIDHNVGRSDENARVSFKITFTRNEVKLNLNYKVYIFLLEIDEAKDKYRPVINGYDDVTIEYIRAEGEDDFITGRALTSFNVQPSGIAEHTFDKRHNLEAGSNEAGNEEYSALIYVIPELTYAEAWTEIDSKNLG